MSKLIDIAKECGAEKHVTFNKNGIHETGKILITPDQLRATVEQVAGHYIHAIAAIFENVDEPPERNCSCHISPPCSDCVEYSGLREAFDLYKEAIAAYTEIMGDKK